MPFAPQIRKNILQALDEHIIPALQTQTPVQILAQPPCDFSEVQNWLVSEQYLADQKGELSQYLWHWYEQDMVANRMQFLGFVFQGVADERIGLTESIANALRQNEQPPFAAITAIRLPAPAVIAIPENVPHRGGSTPYHETDVPGGGPSSILWIHLMSDAVLPHLNSTIHPELSSHSLNIEDPLLAQMGRIYFDELRHVNQDKNASAQHLLLAFMCRLKRHLEQNRVGLSNSCWKLLTPQNSSHFPVPTGRNQEICRRAIDYIQTHLHNPITREILAKDIGVSDAHLSRVFKETIGQSLMAYTTWYRIEAAKMILIEGSERIGDVARLLGFTNTSKFCALFKRQTGYSPRAFARHFKSEHDRDSGFQCNAVIPT